MPQFDDFPQGEFEPELFDMLLNGPLTYRVAMRKARLCACEDPRGGGPWHACKVCRGWGYIWTDIPLVEYQDTLTRIKGHPRPERVSKAQVQEVIEVKDQFGTLYTGVTVDKEGVVNWGSRKPQDGTVYTIRYRAPEQMRLHAQNVRTNRSWAARGEVKEGDLEASIPERLEDLVSPNPAFLAKEHDRFVLLDLEHPVNQRMRRGVREVLLYPRVWGLIAARAILDGLEVVFQPGTDFVVQNGSVQWLTTGPPADTPYVLDYIACPEYYVFGELPQKRHVDGLRLPRRVGLRLFDLYPGRAR